jgi:hypothetical protein
MLSPSKTLDAVAQIISAQSATQSFELKNILITGVSSSPYLEIKLMALGSQQMQLRMVHERYSRIALERN